MIIDVHAHALTRAFLGELARENAFGIEARGDGFGFGGYGPLDPLLFDVEGAVAEPGRPRHHLAAGVTAAAHRQPCRTGPPTAPSRAG